MPLLATLLTALTCALASPAFASCLAGGCHSRVISAPHLHGPLAIEQVAGGGCTACHATTGRRCTPTRAGRFQLRTRADHLCTGCHDDETASSHIREHGACLTCHDPHGGATVALLRRER